jgi:hypothetical protein
MHGERDLARRIVPFHLDALAVEDDLHLIAVLVLQFGTNVSTACCGVLDPRIAD